MPSFIKISLTVSTKDSHKNSFLRQGIEFIGLHSIFKDRSVASAILSYFKNSGPPIICYDNKKPIRNTIFDFNKLASYLDIHAYNPQS